MKLGFVFWSCLTACSIHSLSLSLSLSLSSSLSPFFLSDAASMVILNSDAQDDGFNIKNRTRRDWHMSMKGDFRAYGSIPEQAKSEQS